MAGSTVKGGTKWSSALLPSGLVLLVIKSTTPLPRRGFRSVEVSMMSWILKQYCPPFSRCRPELGKVSTTVPF